ncbi:MAG: hypothetical protein K0R47_5309 [Brevibacillus sp.]|nr:hypothetical protein [Brevibacillus sp.]
MKYRRLGKTDLNVSVVGVGTWQFGGEWGMDFSQRDVDQILDKAKELGINLIDTAECYGDHLSESLIGDYLHRDRREDWVVATKFGHHFHDKFSRTNQYGAAEVLQQLDHSLAALNDELWTMLDKQVQAGKIRHLGLSIAKNENLHQTQSASQVNAKTIQVVYNRLDRKPEEAVFASCEQQDLGVLARVPLASGYLSGKYKPGSVFAGNDVRHRHDQEHVANLLKQVEEIKQNEVPEGMDMAQWALAWCLKHPAVTTVIPGSKSPAQVEANAKAADFVSEDHPQAIVQ